MFQPIASTRSTDLPSTRLPILAWCQDQRLRLIEMDGQYRQAHQEYTRLQRRNLRKPSVSFSRASINSRSTSSKLAMDIIEDETIHSDDSDFDERSLTDLSSSRTTFFESLDNSDEIDALMT
jgi:hypothetical protein